MKYNYLGSTGLRVSQLSIGAMKFGNDIDTNTVFSILDAAYELGINCIDTSDVYSGSEKVLGEYFSETGRRDEFVISTKVGWQVAEGVNTSGYSRTHVARQLKQSMKNLQTDHILVNFAS